MEDSERKEKEILQKVAMKNKKKESIINSRKGKMHCQQKKKALALSFLFGDVKVKEIQNFNSLRFLVMNDGICEKEICRRIGMKKDDYQNISKVLSKMKIRHKDSGTVLIYLISNVAVNVTDEEI